MSYTATRLQHGHTSALYNTRMPHCVNISGTIARCRCAVLWCGADGTTNTYLTYWGDYLSYNLYCSTIYCNLLRYKMYKAQDVLLTTYCINIYSQIFPI